MVCDYFPLGSRRMTVYAHTPRMIAGVIMVCAAPFSKQRDCMDRRSRKAELGEHDLLCSDLALVAFGG